VSHRRPFGYRRLGLLLARQDIRLNHKKLYRLWIRQKVGAQPLFAASLRRILTGSAPSARVMSRNCM
jgi:putative transposase